MFKHGKKQKKALQAAAASAATVATSATSEATAPELERLRSTSSLSVPVAALHVKDTSDANSGSSDDTIGFDLTERRSEAVHSSDAT